MPKLDQKQITKRNRGIVVERKRAETPKLNLRATKRKTNVRVNPYILGRVKTVAGLKRKVNYGSVVKWKTLLDKLEEQKKNPNIVIPWHLDEKTMPFYLLYLLKENKSKCYKKSNYGIIYFDVGNQKMQPEFGTYENELQSIREAYNSCNSDILVIPVGLFNIPSGGSHSNHANMLFLNKKRKEFEHYEPHGGGFALVNEHVKTFSKNLIKLNQDLGLGLKYIPTDETCPLGFQFFEQHATGKDFKHRGLTITNEDGYCGAWSFFYADLRMKFPGKTRDAMYRDMYKILGNDPEELRNFIRGQSLTLSKELIKMDAKYNFGDWIFVLKNLDDDSVDKLGKDRWFLEASDAYNDYLKFEFKNI